MRKWALLVVVLYSIIIAGISIALGTLAVEDVTLQEVSPLIVLWVIIMTFCQIGLLVVPVRVQSRRPVTKRHLFWPVFVAVFSCALMGAGMFLAMYETIYGMRMEDRQALDTVLWLGLLIGVVWIVWAFIFGFYTGGRDPVTFMHRLVRFLIAGSILELLVAVPTHIIARAKDYCCAGWLTVWGLGLGLSVMLFAFGPGVFLLFTRRLRSIRPPSPGTNAQ